MEMEQFSRSSFASGNSEDARTPDWFTTGNESGPGANVTDSNRSATGRWAEYTVLIESGNPHCKYRSRWNLSCPTQKQIVENRENDLQGKHFSVRTGRHKLSASVKDVVPFIVIVIVTG